MPRQRGAERQGRRHAEHENANDRGAHLIGKIDRREQQDAGVKPGLGDPQQKPQDDKQLFVGHQPGAGRQRPHSAVVALSQRLAPQRFISRLAGMPNSA